MNYAQYMRKVLANQKQVIGFTNGQDAGVATWKAQARANTVKVPVPVATSFSQIGGTVGNILETNQQNSSPTSAVCSTGYNGVSNGLQTTDATANVIGAAAHCAVCSDASSAEPYAIEIPCGIFIDPPSNAPGSTNSDKWCATDPGIKFVNGQELVAEQGKQSDLRQRFHLPSKLQGLRGPIVTSR